MNNIKYLIFWSLWTLILLFQQSTRSMAEPQAAPKPLVQVSFERQSIRENDSINAHVWLSNEGDQVLTSLAMHVAAPDFLKWYSDSCTGPQFDKRLDVGPVQSNQVITFTVCLKTESKIVVGEFNTLFTFEYTWQTKDKAGRSFVTLEKPLKASLFGSDTVAGVPLALASYVVPGLFFWIVIAYFNLPWSIKGEPLGDKLIYSLLVSFAIVLIWNRFRFPDVNSGVSLRELAIYAVIGTLLGSVVGGGYILRRRVLENRAQKQNARLVNSSDTDQILLEKLLELHPDLRYPRTRVRFSDGREFIGSLATKTDKLIVLIGWFRIDPEKIPETAQKQFKTLYKEKRLLDLLQLARDMKIPIEPLDPIYEVKDGVPEPLPNQERTWPNEGQSIQPVEEPSQWEPIEIQ
jgi:hypothetical protein